MTQPVIPLDIPATAPDADQVAAALELAPAGPIPEAPAPVQATAPESPREEPDADKLARAKPGRKRSPISKHRTKPELLAAARAQEEELARLRAKLGEGAPQGASPAPDGPAPMSPDQVRQAVTVALDASIELASKMLAAYRGPHWEVSTLERETLRDAWVPILAHYAPQLGTALPWLGAVSTTALVVLPRLSKDAELAAEKKGAAVAPMKPRFEIVADEPAPVEPISTAGRHVGGPV